MSRKPGKPLTQPPALNSSSIYTVACHQHPESQITHFCCLEGCLTPLCLRCIKEHNDMHKAENSYAEIEMLSDVKKFCVNKLRAAINGFSLVRNKLGVIPPSRGGEASTNPSDHKYNEGLRLIESTRAQVLKLVEDHFREVENRFRQLHSSIQPSSTRARDRPVATGVRENIERTISGLEKMITSLNTPTMNDSIKYVLEKDFEEEIFRLNNDVNGPQAQGSVPRGEASGREPTVLVSEPSLGILQSELRRLIVVGEVIKEVPRQPAPATTVSTTYPPQRPQPSPAPPPLPIGRTPQQDLQPVRFPPEAASRIRDFQVTMPDYFDRSCQNKVLHFFQHKSKRLHILTIGKIYDLIANRNAGARNTGEYVHHFETVHLNIDFNIPRWHRSIITPFGDIYLTGGVSVENEEVKLEAMYLYSPTDARLKPLANMTIPRSGHGIVYLAGFIYVIGGFTTDDFTAHCERYEITANRWEEIAPLAFKANNCCATVFRGRFIYKFGGKQDDNILNNYIERYDPVINRWEIVDLLVDRTAPQTEVRLLSSMAAVQINEHQILVFGGTYEDYAEKSNQSFILHIDDESEGTPILGSPRRLTRHEVREINSKVLPMKEGFWNNTPIVQDQLVLALQNIQSEIDRNIVYLDRRRILLFDSTKWDALN
eukprot:TRINITY_DN4879_c0_g1_i4.p1 TRINITY_DN4879_c0_g1~~TRINITY_DN4879_c0_g1_i4.p1  ORF type:complete len:656 (-),score=78.28 TRINITY_DN4879_c0_g1_i4:165-2132(-)